MQLVNWLSSRRPSDGLIYLHPIQSTEARRSALAELLPYQREDFEGIFRCGRECSFVLVLPLGLNSVLNSSKLHTSPHLLHSIHTFRSMDGLPVTIRLLDPPLHEFLPDGDMEEVWGEVWK